MGLAGNKHFQHILVLELVLTIENKDDRETIQISDVASDLSGNEKIADEKRVANFLSGHANGIRRLNH